MSQAKFSTYAKVTAFERLFDHAVSLVIITMGALIAGATVFAGA